MGEDGDTAGSCRDMLWAADGALSFLVVHLPTGVKEVREGVSATVSLGMHVELEEFVPCAKQFLLLQGFGKLKPKIEGGEGAFGRGTWCRNLSYRWVSLADFCMMFPVGRD